MAMDSLCRGGRNRDLASDLDAADIRYQHSLSKHDDDPLHRSRLVEGFIVNPTIVSAEFECPCPLPKIRFSSY